jgi:hypothetical protein
VGGDGVAFFDTTGVVMAVFPKASYEQESGSSPLVGSPLSADLQGK